MSSSIPHKADNSVQLMPFHIQHDGPAPISTYFLVEAAPDEVAKPVPPPATEDEMQVDSVEENKDATLPRRVTDATTRFLATFRGRTMHGLKMALPEGYTGVIFNGGAGSPTAKAGVKPKSKAKPKKRAGRATRSATRLDDEDEEMETADAVEARPLEPAARFSSFVLWTPDIPVDLGRDEYGRSLSEWISLAKEETLINFPLASCRRRPSLHNSVRFAPASPPQNMFSSVVLATILASNALLSHADVTPNEPAPGDSFNEGASCTLGWAGDTNSTTNWLNMAIELMTGPNEAMVHLTTVATGQDGTKAGTFSYTCPGVTLNAPVYFYQFTAPGTPDYQWTGRFTIAATNGSSVAAPQTEQSDGTTVHFGTGSLTDPSTAVAAPNFSSSSSSSSSNSTTGSNSSAGPAVSNSATSAPVNTAAAAGGPAPAANSTHSTLPTSASAGASQSSGTSAAVAVGPLSLDTRMMPVAAALFASVVAGTMLL
ncbi:hypothetical protein HMN09_01342300 [Mycena chlorophos]|uniref:Yeast cell wall synthesis Kre9/Knh1-like N-terminal domain-containing protein n=1 Tax=Mycena chlorophos TaxID=658473 RepID=A0A8H6RYW4_MYCCL|nr:hypothetical protein HMN09_01342300 [Mycena chlorophos]